MNCRLRTALAFVLSFAGGSITPPVFADTTIPIDKCSSQRAMMQLSYESMQRESKAAPGLISANESILRLASKYDGVAQKDRPLRDYLTKDEVAQMATLSSQITTARLYQLAESRLQRDMDVLSKMQEMATKALQSGLSLKEGDADYNVYSYLRALRAAFDGMEHPKTEAKNICTLDLALQTESEAAYAVFNRMVSHSAEMIELLGLREKYHVASG